MAPMLNTVDINDQLYRNYVKWRSDPAILVGYYGYIYRKINALANLKAGNLVLELGFGEGHYLEICREDRLDARGIEINKDFYDQAAKNGHDVFLGDFLNFEWTSDRKFNALVAFDVFEHLTHEQILKYLRKASELLLDGGVVVLKFPNGNSPFGGIHQHGDATHISILSGSKMRQLGLLEGFDLILEKNCPRYLVGKLGGLKARMMFGAFKVLELFLSKVVYGSYVPMDPNLVVILRKQSAPT